MRHVQEHRPATFSIKDLDSELMCMATLRALSDDPSCAVLVSTLLHSTDKLSDIDKLKTELVDEDMNRRTSPALYGLKADAQGVLRAAEVVDTANAALAAAAAAAAAQKKSKPAFSSTPAPSGTSAVSAAPRAACAHCKGRHPTKKCYGKQIANLTKQLAAARGATADFPESAGSATMARAHSSLAASNGADNVWIADTGTTAHMTPRREWFASYRPLRTPVRLADGNIVHSAGVGTVVFMPRLSGPEIEFSRVLHVPALSCNLFSVLHLVRFKGFFVCAEGETISFSLAGQNLFTASITERNTAFLDGPLAFLRLLHFGQLYHSISPSDTPYNASSSQQSPACFA